MKYTVWGILVHLHNDKALSLCKRVLSTCSMGNKPLHIINIVNYIITTYYSVRVGILNYITPCKCILSDVI